MQQTQRPVLRRSLWTRGAALLLAIVLALGLVPGLSGISETAAAHWADPYLSQLVEWGFIRPDQAENPDSFLTRADFMAIINRAYGYTQGGATPFEDVEESDWFYDDVGIAYNAQYIYGTSPTTVSPNDTLTRETAATILGRNMMLKESEGEILDFSDAREISPWARGTIKSSLEHYLVSGYDDGTFKPQKELSWGEMAAMLSRIVGTPLREGGDYSMGGVFGNVTISSPGVTLRDTIISGDLYVTGGVGLGDVKLENVTVLGRIIASGTGESESGRSSITLRNVVADELLVDNLQDHFVTIQADGITEIGRTTVRTDAYLEDNTPEGLGLKNISLEGEEGTLLDLAGRIESVAVKTPGAQVQVAKGTVNTMTVDETAPDTNVTIARGASIKELNLDTGAYVSGDGDIKKLNVNAPGAIVTMLPDEIYIRPGITAVIKDEVMDSVAAEESSLDPMILAGYPSVSDLAPTSLTAIFSTNKKGTVYWAVSAITDSSISPDDLIKPPAYGSTAVARGTLSVARGNEETGAPVTGLLAGGSYYLSAVLVDDRGQRSPAKVIAFTTPDDSVPAFADGYPYMSLVTDTMAQVTVMPTKTCKLYYALLPAGAQAPTEDELKTNSVSGRLGYGVRDVVKNTEDVFQVNDLTLEEMESYDLYLWLVDANGINKSQIEKLTFSTVDKTPPEFIVDLTVDKIEDTSVGLTFRLNESGTVYWAVVPAGADYPRPRPGQDSILPSDEYAKLQVQSGLNALKFGSVKVTGTANGTINVSGLTAETSYDLWYVAVDEAGNYSAEVKKVSIHTRDNTGPVVEQHFTSYTGSDDSINPEADTDIILSFDEDVLYRGTGGGESLRELYNAYSTAATADKDTALQRLVTSLSNTIKLYPAGGSGARKTPVPSNVDVANRDVAIENIQVDGQPCVLDYTKATVTSKDGRVLVTFPRAALNLNLGSTYYFEISQLENLSGIGLTPSTVNYSVSRPTVPDSKHNVPQFTVAFAQLYLKETELSRDQYPAENVDFSFRVEPISTSQVDTGMCYDLLLWSNLTMDYDLYYRAVDSRGAQHTAEYPMPRMAGKIIDSATGWVRLGNSTSLASSSVTNDPSSEDTVGLSWGSRSLHANFNGCEAAEYPALSTLNDSGSVYYEFAIVVTRLGTNPNRPSWNDKLDVHVTAAASSPRILRSLANTLTWSSWRTSVKNGVGNQGVASIGDTRLTATPDRLPMSWPFEDVQVPKFYSTAPEFVKDATNPALVSGDTYVTLNLNLDRAGEIYYAISPVQNGMSVKATVAGREYADAALEPFVPESGDMTGSADRNKLPPTGSDLHYTESGWVNADTPSARDIYLQTYKNFPKTVTGIINCVAGQAFFTSTVRGLEPSTEYYAYFVLKGRSNELSQVYLYKFTTKESSLPKITLDLPGDGTVNASTDVDADVFWIMFNAEQLRNYPPFSSNLIDLVPEADKHGFPKKSDGSDYTVLEAMLEDFRASAGSDKAQWNGYTIFDAYAPDTLKRTVANIAFDGSQLVGVTQVGKDDFEYVAKDGQGNKNPPAVVDCRENKDSEGNLLMTSASQFVLIAVARNANLDVTEDSTDTDKYRVSFRASQNITVPNFSRPEVTMVTTSITRQREVNGQYLYSGSVSIQFSEPLYWIAEGSTKAFPVVVTTNTPPATFDPSTATSIELFQYCSGDIGANGYIKMGNPISYASRTYRLVFTDMPAGATIEFFTTGTVCSSGGSRTNKSLSLSFREYQAQGGGNDSGANIRDFAGFMGTWGTAPADVTLDRMKITAANGGSY